MKVMARERTLVVIDPAVENYQDLLAGIDPEARAVVLDSERDGIAQISEILVRESEVSALHIVAHGEVGRVRLGNSELTHATLENYGAQLQQWADALSDRADLLFYGCNLAAGETGSAFLQELAKLTGADIAASDDVTGSLFRGGDWELEVNTGSIEARSPFAAELMARYPGLLALPTAPTNNLDVSGATYIGGSGDDFANAVDISPTGGIVVLGGDWPGHDPGGTSTDLLGGGTGAIVRYDSATNAVLSTTRVPSSVKDLEINSTTGEIAIAGDFGVAVLSPDARTVVWSANPGAVERVAIDDSGTVAALRDVGGGTDEIRVYNSSGAAIGSWNTGSSSRHFNDVAITAQNGGTVVVTGYHQKSSQLQVAFNQALSYDGSAVKWTGYDFSASAIQSANKMADTRGIRVAIGRDGQLYIAHKVNGGTGSSIFSRDPLNLSASAAANTVQTDSYNTPNNVGSVDMTWYGRYDLASGGLLKGQSLLTRLSSGSGNSLRRNSIAADEQGNVYIAGDASYAIANRDGQQLAGEAIGPYAGDGHVLIVKNDFSERLVWTPFPGGSGKAFNVRNGIAAAALTVNSTNAQVTHNALQTTSGGGQDGYLAVIGGNSAPVPTVEPDNSDSLNGTFGEDSLIGGSADQTIVAHKGNDYLDGGDGNDVLYGHGDNDTLFGGGGHDSLYAGWHDDMLYGGTGNDTLYADGGNDWLEGNEGEDRLFGQTGSDRLVGGAGNDSVYGGTGNDTLSGVDPDNPTPGAAEVDLLRGDGGSDTFVLGDGMRVYYDDRALSTPGTVNLAILADFNKLEDRIQLHGSAASYQLADVTTGTGIYYTTGQTAPELIAIARNVSSTELNLNESYFTYV
ncbi:DUF4347 domain-containing protein [Oxynema aestuarii AP17]|uniref:DUF4347 domain-containing protein n=2 Tax=Oxynema TaxID=1492710 RepID=A0A6H1U362_9CYAN|nr:DUF4347 domain-containing protein [Oxynema aestuarii AP17]